MLFFTTFAEDANVVEVIRTDGKIGIEVGMVPLTVSLEVVGLA